MAAYNLANAANKAPLCTLNYRSRKGEAPNDDNAISRWAAGEAVLVEGKTPEEAARLYGVSLGIVRAVVRAIRRHVQ